MQTRRQTACKNGLSGDDAISFNICSHLNGTCQNRSRATKTVRWGIQNGNQLVADADESKCTLILIETLRFADDANKVQLFAFNTNIKRGFGRASNGQTINGKPAKHTTKTQINIAQSQAMQFISAKVIFVLRAVRFITRARHSNNVATLRNGVLQAKMRI